MYQELNTAKLKTWLKRDAVRSSKRKLLEERCRQREADTALATAASNAALGIPRSMADLLEQRRRKRGVAVQSAKASVILAQLHHGANAQSTGDISTLQLPSFAVSRTVSIWPSIAGVALTWSAIQSISISDNTPAPRAHILRARFTTKAGPRAELLDGLVAASLPVAVDGVATGCRAAAPPLRPAVFIMGYVKGSTFGTVRRRWHQRLEAVATQGVVQASMGGSAGVGGPTTGTPTTGDAYAQACAASAVLLDAWKDFCKGSHTRLMLQAGSVTPETRRQSKRDALFSMGEASTFTTTERQSVSSASFALPAGQQPAEFGPAAHQPLSMITFGRWPVIASRPLAGSGGAEDMGPPPPADDISIEELVIFFVAAQRRQVAAWWRHMQAKCRASAASDIRHIVRELQHLPETVQVDCACEWWPLAELRGPAVPSPEPFMPRDDTQRILLWNSTQLRQAIRGSMDALPATDAYKAEDVQFPWEERDARKTTADGAGSRSTILGVISPFLISAGKRPW